MPENRGGKYSKCRQTAPPPAMGTASVEAVMLRHYTRQSDKLHAGHAQAQTNSSQECTGDTAEVGAMHLQLTAKLNQQCLGRRHLCLSRGTEMKIRHAPGRTFVALRTCESPKVCCIAFGLRAHATTRWLSACPSSSSRLHIRRIDAVYPEIDHPRRIGKTTMVSKLLQQVGRKLQTSMH